MPHPQPTVRRLQPLARRHHSAPVVEEHREPADTSVPDRATTAAPRPRGLRRLAAGL